MALPIRKARPHARFVAFLRERILLYTGWPVPRR